MDIDEWEDSLPDYLHKNQDVETSVSGSNSLHLALLSLKMLVSRISLHAVGQIDDPSSPEILKYRQFECRKAAQNIVDFVQSLTSSHLGEFWLPYGAYYLTSTTTLLLRFAVETTDDSVAESCVSSVKTLTQRLRQAKDDDDWDLADDSLSQCDGILARITHNARPQGEIPAGNLSGLAHNPLEIDAPPGDWLDATLPAFYGPMDGSGQMRDVWNMFDFEPFNI
ncbi:C6 transcription factor [Phlyctema vagabunda]|uniref:C6 transcription factor n=1 Tax=Phlyctema vagabunda TaxID=108571 RepID=A0ABR4PYA7_9HELO